jgi:ABC-type Mn2+/Zn2+ transport system permease subunit
MSRLTAIFQHAATINALLGVGIIAVLCSYLGVFIMLRRDALAGVVLAQASPLGIALALYLSGLLTSDAFNPVRLSPPLLALALTMIAATLIALPHRERRPRRYSPSALAWLAVGALAAMVVASLAIVGAASIVHAKAEMLYLLFGNRLTVTTAGVMWLTGLACSIGVVHWLFYREFLFVSFDPDMAVALGRRARWWNVLLFLTIGITISLAIRAAGALVVLNFLVLPAATALLVTRRIQTTFILSIILGVVTSFVGITLSQVAGLPHGPTITGVSLVMLLITGSIKLVRR